MTNVSLNHSHHSKRILALFVIASMLFPSFATAAGLAVAPGSGATTVTNAPNGVPVVNIDKANGAGLSHNRFTDYNVNTNGLILNNANSSQMQRQSKLAGQILANPNLAAEARVILNEVVAPNRSQLLGFTEVVGGRADVIVANPYGITCKGCGFINTDRATLTTGTPNIGANGSLTGFNVNSGDVLIGGTGVNATAQQIFDIVARSIRVDGNINLSSTGTLGITTGNNVWNYAGRNVTGATTGSGAAPLYAFDSTLLGGMYAGRISIIATEAGVGVRMLGNAAASADDFILNSAGKIEVGSAVSAARDLSFTTTSSTGTQDLLFNGATAKASASRNISLSATTGQVTLSEGELYAANNLALTATSLSDVSTTAKTRFAEVNNSLTTTGVATIDGASWGAGSALFGSFDSLTIGANGGTLYAGTTLGLNATNNLSLATAAVRSTGNMTLTATTGAISTAAGAAQGIHSISGNLNLTAGNGLNNQGTISSSGSMALTGSGLVNGSAINSGAKLFGGTGSSFTLSSDLLNYAAIHSFGDLTINAANITNTSTGGLSAGTSLNLAASGNIDNSGALYAGTQLTATATVNLTNNFSGTMDSAGSMTLSAGAIFTNNHTINAFQNINVDAPTFLNSVPGNPTRQVTTLYGQRLPDTVTITCTGICKPAVDIPWSDNGAGLSRTWWMRTDSDVEYFTFTGGITALPAPADKPQIIAGLALNLSGFTTAKNVGGLLTATDMTITGALPAATFTNDDLSLTTTETTYYWVHYIKGFQHFYNDTIGGQEIHRYTQPFFPIVDPKLSAPPGFVSEQAFTEWSGFPLSGTTLTPHLTKSSTPYGAGVISTNAATFTNANLAVNSSPFVTKPASGPSKGTINPVFIAPQLPTNPNGYFVISQKPGSQYLVETNPLFVSGASFTGSDYMMELYGYSPEQEIRRLGDANYEAYLIKQQLIAQTGKSILDGYDNEAKQMKRLMDQAVAEGKKQGFEFGKELTPDQIANLKSDVVWMVETEVAGQTVLAPVVYLASETREAIQTGSVIAAKNLNLDVTSVTNTGGTISGSESLNITSKRPLHRGDLRYFPSPFYLL